MPELNYSEWENFTSQFPDSHLLQTGNWGELKSTFGWDVVRIASKNPASSLLYDTGAQVLFRKIFLDFTFAYIPKGPLGIGDVTNDVRTWDLLWPEVDKVCKKHNAVFLKVEPDCWGVPAGIQGGQTHGFLPPKGFHTSSQSIQPTRTLEIDIRGDDAHVLARMKQKTRYNIRLAQRKGVVAFQSSDLDTFFRLMHTTSKRDRFSVHSLAYYHRVYELFHPKGECELLMAEFEGEPLASIMVFGRGKRAWYFYGASSNIYRESMPTYLLQWEAIRWARERGSTHYDLWGVPDYDLETLESEFSRRNDGLWGVYRFKRGFGGVLKSAISPWDRVYMKIPYMFYRWWVHLRASNES